METDTRELIRRLRRLCPKHRWSLMWASVLDGNESIEYPRNHRLEVLERALACPSCLSRNEMALRESQLPDNSDGQLWNPSSASTVVEAPGDQQEPPAWHGFGDRRKRRHRVLDLGWVIAVSTAVAFAAAVTASWGWPRVPALQGSGDGQLDQAAGNGSGVSTEDVSKLKVGDCVRDMSSDSWEVVNCSIPHSDEVYGTFMLSVEDYPGVKRLELLAWSECDKRFEAYTGLTAGKNTFEEYISTPTAETWAEGDRIVVCTVAASRPSTGTMRNFGR